MICEDDNEHKQNPRIRGVKTNDFADNVDVDALLSAPEKPTLPYYWHTSETSSSAVVKRPRRRKSTMPSERQVTRAV